MGFFFILKSLLFWCQVWLKEMAFCLSTLRCKFLYFSLNLICFVTFPANYAVFVQGHLEKNSKTCNLCCFFVAFFSLCFVKLAWCALLPLLLRLNLFLFAYQCKNFPNCWSPFTRKFDSSRIELFLILNM